MVLCNTCYRPLPNAAHRLAEYTGECIVRYEVVDESLDCQLWADTRNQRHNPHPEPQTFFLAHPYNNLRRGEAQKLETRITALVFHYG